MDAKDKKHFRETHPELTIYDAAVKELRAHYGKERFPSRKLISEELQTLISEKNGVYERYCVARDHYREMQAVRTNYYALGLPTASVKNTLYVHAATFPPTASF